MEKFKVIQSANLGRCDLPGYKQDYEVYNMEGKWCGAWLGAPNGEPEQAETKIIIRSHFVVSENPIGAIIKFKKWEAQGLDDEFLISNS